MPNHKGKEKGEDKNKNNQTEKGKEKGEDKNKNNQTEKGMNKEKENDRQGKRRNENAGLADVLQAGEWVLVFTNEDENPVFGQVKQVNREVIILENLLIPIVREILIPLHAVEKIFAFGNDPLMEDQLDQVLNNL